MDEAGPHGGGVPFQDRHDHTPCRHWEEEPVLQQTPVLALLQIDGFMLADGTSA